MEMIKLRDQLGQVRSFRGELIPEARNNWKTHEDDGTPRLRWVEMTVYRHAEGGYVLHRNGRTAPVAHRRDAHGKCKDDRHEFKAGSDLPATTIPCPVCLGAQEKERGWRDRAMYAVEVDRPLVDRCQTPEDLIDVLTEYRNTPGGRQPYLSRPAEELLNNLARVDDLVMEVWHDQEVPI